MNLTDEATKPPPGCHYRFVPGWGRGLFPNPWVPKTGTSKRTRSRAELEALIHDLEAQLSTMESQP